MVIWLHSSMNKLFIGSDKLNLACSMVIDCVTDLPYDFNIACRRLVAPRDCATH